MKNHLTVDEETRAGRNRILVASVLAGIASFLVYLRTMAPTVYGLDSAELSAGAWSLGIVHSPGSPLYLLVAHLFTRLPFGDVGWRVNLFSVLCGSLTIGLLVYFLRKMVGRTWVALAASLILAFSFYFWVWALVAELYGPHMLLVVVLLILLHRYDTHRTKLRMGLLAAAFGLALGNHLAVVLLLPGFLWILFADGDSGVRRRGVLLSGLLSGLLAFIAIYAYLPLRHAASPGVDMVRDYFPDVDMHSIEGLVWMISGRMFESLFLKIPLRDVGVEVSSFVAQLFSNFTVLGIGFGAVGIVKGVNHNFRWQCGLMMMFLAHALFYLTYGAPDRSWMYSTAYIIWTIWLALGVFYLDEWLQAKRKVVLGKVLKAAVFLVAIQLLVCNFYYADVSDDYSARDLGEGVFGALPEGAVYYGGWHDVPVMEYLQVVEGARADVGLKNLVLMQGRDVAGQSMAYIAEHRSVYTCNTNMFGGMNFSDLSASQPGLYQVLP